VAASTVADFERGQRTPVPNNADAIRRALRGPIDTGKLLPKRAQEILGYADVRTTLATYTHAMKRKHDDSADRMAQIAGLSPAGDIRDTNDDVRREEAMPNDCSERNELRLTRHS